MRTKIKKVLSALLVMVMVLGVIIAMPTAGAEAEIDPALDNNGTTAKAGNTSATINIDKTTFASNEIISIRYSGFTEDIFEHYSVCIDIYDKRIPARIENKYFTTLDESGKSGTVEFQMPTSPAAYEVRLYFYYDKAGDYVYATIPVTVTSKNNPSSQTPLTSQNITGSWGWFYQLDSIGNRFAEVYQFNQDGTFSLYKASSIYRASSVGYTFISAYEAYIKGRYAISGNKINFAGVESSGSKTITANGDANGSGLSFGTRQRAIKVWNLAPKSGYFPITLDSLEYAIIDKNTIGFLGNQAFGSDGYYHYDSNWIR